MTQPSNVLANRRWLRRAWPFPHIVARNVFEPTFYSELSDQLVEMLQGGLSDYPARGRFSRNIPGYDAYGIGLDHSIPEPASIFLSCKWRDMMCDLFGITRTPYVFAGAHHHAIGSKNGFIHNDFNPVWFIRSDTSKIQIPRQELCTYKTGDGPTPDAQKIQVVRGAVMILFLANDGWQASDGGETGLFSSCHSSLSEPALRCTPENNSLVAFECTPNSFHAFLTNRRLPRTSIIMWVHRPLAEAVAKYGEGRLEAWKR